MPRLRQLLSFILVLPLCASSQQGKQPTGNNLTIRLEQFRNEKVIPVRPEHVFAKDDVLRFRLSPSSDGYIYVVNHAASGEYSVLFPSASSSANNVVHGGTEFYVPTSEDGWFQVGGEPGFDTVYFLLSPVKLAVSTDMAKPKAPEKLPANLLPRCNDSIFQSRGECVDDSAGPAVLPRGAALPPQISTAAPNASRDLVLVNEPDGQVKVTKSSAGPAVYIFRIAHK